MIYYSYFNFLVDVYIGFEYLYWFLIALLISFLNRDSSHLNLDWVCIVTMQLNQWEKFLWKKQKC